MTNGIFFEVLRDADDESVSSFPSSRASDREQNHSVENDLPRYSALSMAGLLALKQKVSSGVKQIRRTGATTNEEYLKKNRKHLPSSSSSLPFHMNWVPPTDRKILEPSTLKHLSAAELNIVTMELGPGGSIRPVYKGWIYKHPVTGPSGHGSRTAVAVKKIIKGAQSDAMWLAKIKYLGKFNHPNLVKLVGYRLEDKHRLLVSEFLPQRSLEDHLFHRRSGILPLSWSLRMKIALGTAKALAFLHASNPQVIHGNVKSSNILLGSNYNVKLSDFGLIKDFSTSPPAEPFQGSVRVCCLNECSAPESFHTGELTIKTDVYCYGLVLLELLLGQRVVNRTRPSIVELFGVADGVVVNIDSRIKNQYTLKDAEMVIALAQLCRNDDAMDRPDMDFIVKALERLFAKNGGGSN